MPAVVDRKTRSAWEHHLADEGDAAFLYRRLAAVEPDPRRREIFESLARIEDRHVDVWQRLLRDHGIEPRGASPTARARLLAAASRVFGTSALATLMLREEGEEVKSYLNLHRESTIGAARDTALTLARESAEHAETLRGITGGDSEPWHRIESGGYLRNVVYGFNDGLTANFGLVAGVIGAAVEPHIVLVTGLAGMLADALSMGSSGYLAAKSEQEVYAHEIAMEREELRLMPDLEREELSLIYQAKGMDRERSDRLAGELMRDPERALQEKVREELGISEARVTPFREGWITGLSTAVGAFIPVAPFLVLHGAAAAWTAFAVAMLSHFAVGAARSVFTGRSIFRSGFDMFVVGLGVAGVGYLVGDLLVKWR